MDYAIAAVDKNADVNVVGDVFKTIEITDTVQTKESFRIIDLQNQIARNNDLIALYQSQNEDIQSKIDSAVAALNLII